MESCPNRALERCLASLDFLSGLVPGQPIVPYSFIPAGSSVALGHTLSDWLISAWTNPSRGLATSEVMLHLLVTINNHWLGGMGNPQDFPGHNDLIKWSADPSSFANHVIKQGFSCSSLDDAGMDCTRRNLLPHAPLVV
ncbi:unnamed protein product [Echinostoma caproni]|uniref:Myotubularin phosphatase domain-containing protein n=1 Tax=Echinostoma caproni TaxID=27848 RepID=A0A183B1C0_9TREM|nr:unnamed protein product [Echinostoma caproni]